MEDAIGTAQKPAIGRNDVGVCSAHDAITEIAGSLLIPQEDDSLSGDGGRPPQQECLMGKCTDNSESGRQPCFGNVGWLWCHDFNPDPCPILIQKQIWTYAMMDCSEAMLLKLIGQQYLGELLPIHGILRRAELLQCISVSEPSVEKGSVCSFQRGPKRCAVLALVRISPPDCGGKIEITHFTVRHFGARQQERSGGNRPRQDGLGGIKMSRVVFSQVLAIKAFVRVRIV
ncbi:hypothetical protein [Mesorhizobium sp. M0244]|uniref:hypothetical protein n=1 Tax=Mesorhizobium sp. M0244 TaxID=2956926 RepID=UPI003339002B